MYSLLANRLSIAKRELRRSEMVFQGVVETVKL